MKPEALNADVFLSMQNALTALSLLIRKLEKLSANNRLAYQEALSNARTLKEQLSKNLHAYVSGEIDTTAFTVCCHINLLNARLNNRNRFFDEWSSFLNSVQSLYYRSSSDIGWKNSESEQLSTLLRESNSYKLLEKLLSNYPDNGTLFCLTYPDCSKLVGESAH